MSETFCIYCQREYTSIRRFQRHLRLKHQGTYAQQNLAPDPVGRVGYGGMTEHDPATCERPEHDHFEDANT